MVSIRAGIVLFLLLSTGLWAQQPPPVVLQRVGMLESADAPGHVDRERLARNLWQLMREQGLDLQQAPHIMVFHVSKEVAGIVGIKGSIGRTARHEQTGSVYYQLWLVGEPKAPDYITGLQMILQHAFSLQQTPKELEQVLSRVGTMDSATVDAKSFSDPGR